MVLALSLTTSLSVLLFIVMLADVNARPTRSPIPLGPVAIPKWEQQQMVNVINQARATTVLPAANMEMMEWNDSLASLAQTFTNQCGCFWKQYKNAFLSWCDEMPDPVSVVKWRLLRMAPYYNYTDGGCINTPQSLQICEHPDNYEAMMYPNTNQVGCAMTECWPDRGPKSLFHACIVGGVRPRQPGKPFPIGPRCSQCDVVGGWKYCNNGLCSKVQPSPTRSPSVNPTHAPTKFPTKTPTRKPTLKPSRPPTRKPTLKPTQPPTRYPTHKPSVSG